MSRCKGARDGEPIEIEHSKVPKSRRMFLGTELLCGWIGLQPFSAIGCQSTDLSFAPVPVCQKSGSGT
jgi:hypothetical protein